jgi:glycosyltransferase involved in cell wall biosynthesis
VDAVTVCMTARNAEATIGGSIRSLLRALPSTGRVLVRDDGSSDRTSEVVRRESDRRVRLLDDTRPLGIPASRNALLEEVRTPILAVLDADDRAFPWRFRRQVRLLSRGVDMVFSPVVVRKPPIPIPRPQLFPALSTAGVSLALLLENPLMHPTMTARADVMRGLGGYRAVAAEDFDLYLRACAAGHSLIRDSVPTVLYLRHSAQITVDPAWNRSKNDTSLVEDAFGSLGTKTLGFVPSWFAWRRAGFPSAGAPENLEEELEAVDAVVRDLPRPERRYLGSRVARIRSAVPA